MELSALKPWLVRLAMNRFVQWLFAAPSVCTDLDAGLFLFFFLGTARC